MNAHDHNPLEHSCFNKLSVMSNEVQGPFTLSLLESALGALHLPPLDIKHLARSCFLAGQYLINFQELAAEQTGENQGQSIWILWKKCCWEQVHIQI